MERMNSREHWVSEKYLCWCLSDSLKWCLQHANKQGIHHLLLTFKLLTLKAIYLSVIRKIYVFHLHNVLYLQEYLTFFGWIPKVAKKIVFLPRGIFGKVSKDKYDLASFHPGADDLRSFPNFLTHDITLAWVWVLRSRRVMLLDPISNFFSYMSFSMVA